MTRYPDFKAKWNAVPIPGILAPEDLALVTLAPTTPVLARVSGALANFLVTNGLPPDAAPFLTFHLSEHGLCQIWDLYGHPNDWCLESRARLTPFLMIGEDGAGNPICIDLSASERVVLLDHEDWFQTITFINSSIEAFAESMLACRIYSMGADLKVAIDAIDPVALNPGSFWTSVVNDPEE